MHLKFWACRTVANLPGCNYLFYFFRQFINPGQPMPALSFSPTTKLPSRVLANHGNRDKNGALVQIPTYYLFVTKSRIFPEFAIELNPWLRWYRREQCRVVNLKPDWDLWKWTMPLAFKTKLWPINGWHKSISFHARGHWSAILYLYFLTYKSLWGAS